MKTDLDGEKRSELRDHNNLRVVNVSAVLNNTDLVLGDISHVTRIRMCVFTGWKDQHLFHRRTINRPKESFSVENKSHLISSIKLITIFIIDVSICLHLSYKELLL